MQLLDFKEFKETFIFLAIIITDYCIYIGIKQKMIFFLKASLLASVALHWRYWLFFVNQLKNI